MGLCHIVDDDDIESCPSLLGLRDIYKGGNELGQPSFQEAQRRPWQPHAQGMLQDHSLQFYPFYNSFTQ